MDKNFTLADLPAPPAWFNQDQLEKAKEIDLEALNKQHLINLDRANLFHRLLSVGLYINVGVFVKIGNKKIPYIVTRIDSALHQISITKWYFEEATGGDRTIELVSKIQNPDQWNPIVELEGFFGSFHSCDYDHKKY